MKSERIELKISKELKKDLNEFIVKNKYNDTQDAIREILREKLNNNKLSFFEKIKFLFFK